MKYIACLALIPALAACTGPGWPYRVGLGVGQPAAPTEAPQATAPGPNHNAAATEGGVSAPPPEARTLYSWDGGVVESPQPGVAQDHRPPTHGLEPGGAGRMHIIELYQEVLEERDALRIEADALMAALEQAQQDVTKLETMLAEAEQRGAALEEQHAALEAEHVDLAARLVTAQIRRLESEKVLLESKIEWHRLLGAQPEKASANTAGRENR